MTNSAIDAVQRFVGSTDIYVLDQIVKGRIAAHHRVLDVGTGAGRNLRWPLLAGCDVWAVDRKDESIEHLLGMARELGVTLSADHVQVATLPDLPFDNDKFDVVVCIAVLHFAANHAEFDAMVREVWRVLKPGGLLLVRTASEVGLGSSLERDADGRARLPDGTDRYVVEEDQLADLTGQLHAKLLEPIKSVVVHGQRAMTTWCIQKEQG